jgi:lipid-A-disaccharide synthase
MKPKEIMLVAGERSGDLLAAELVAALRQELAAADSIYTSDTQPLLTGLEPRFFGAGGTQMRLAGVDVVLDLVKHSVTGLSDVLLNLLKFRRLLRQLIRLAVQREPDVIIGIDYGGFNLRFAHAIRRIVRGRSGIFQSWRPRLVQYVSPQVWASREGRAYQMARDYDLLLSLFPFEKEWYAARVPRLRVEFVGHPVVDRHLRFMRQPDETRRFPEMPMVVLLPGSRPGEVKRHLPVMLGALQQLRTALPQLRALTVLPDEPLAALARPITAAYGVEIQAGGLPVALRQAELALASTGTVTLECAYFGVPAVTMYRTSWGTYHAARPVVRVKSLTMPNLLAGRQVFPEFIQSAATPDRVAQAALELLRDESRRKEVRATLKTIVSSLGGPGASRRAARAIVSLLKPAGKAEGTGASLPAGARGG